MYFYEREENASWPRITFQKTKSVSLLEQFLAALKKLKMRIAFGIIRN